MSIFGSSFRKNIGELRLDPKSGLHFTSEGLKINTGNGYAKINDKNELIVRGDPKFAIGKTENDRIKLKVKPKSGLFIDNKGELGLMLGYSLGVSSANQLKIVVADNGYIENLPTGLSVNKIITRLLEKNTELEKLIETNIKIYESSNEYIKNLESNISKNEEIIEKLKTDISKKKNYITVVGEANGPLKEGEVFSMGNGGKDKSVGYTVMRKCKVVSFGLSYTKIKNFQHVFLASFALTINGVRNNLCNTTIDFTQGSTFCSRRFENDIIINQGQIINFVVYNIPSLATEERFVNNKVATLLLEVL